MKNLLIFFFFIVSSAYSQTSDALKLCVAIQNKFTSNYEANNAVDKILSVIGTSQKPILQPCSNLNNAVAASYKGQRYILYDKVFMESLTVGRNKYWSNMFILAHEVGHHINGHSLDIILYQNDVINPKSLSTIRSQELEADEFAGFVLAKLGATFNQTSKVLLNIPKISNDYDSTHPSTDKRIRAVKNGWERGYVKKETKTVYVSDAIGEYERSDSYMRYGKWYREQNDDVFEGRSWTAITSGVLKGSNDYFNKAPIIKIMKNKKFSKSQFYIKEDVLKNLPSIGSKVYGTLIILESYGEIIYEREIVIPLNEKDYYFNKKNGFYKVSFKDNYSVPLRYFKEGSKLLIRLNDYKNHISHEEIKKYTKNKSFYKINDYNPGGGYSKLWGKMINRNIYISSKYPLYVNSQSPPIPETNYSNRLFSSYELIQEINKLKKIYANCIYAKKGGLTAYTVSYSTPSGTLIDEKFIPYDGNCTMDISEYDKKVNILLQKLLDFNSVLFTMKKQVIEVEGAYFEYSLSGSSKALAE